MGAGICAVNKLARHALLDRCLLPAKWKAVFRGKATHSYLAASRSGGLQTAEFERGRFGKRPSLLSLMHPGRHAVAVVGLDAGRAAAEGAENHDRGDEGE